MKQLTGTSVWRRAAVSITSLGLVAASGIWLVRAQDPKPGDQDEPQWKVEHADCAFFGGERERLGKEARRRFSRSDVTADVASRLAPLPAADMAASVAAPTPAASGNLIDSYLFAAMKDAGVTPAAKTTDWEFIRRVSLDLTGRIPQVDKLADFVDSPAQDKRAALVDQLLASPEWVDKWSMYYGDLLKNAQVTTNINRYPTGRNAFYNWIRDSLTANKPYNQMVTELIGAKGVNNFNQGDLNWIIGGRVTGGPIQDTWDQMAAMSAEQFLGIAHLNCLLCHNGRGHLDQLSLWGKNQLRTDAWGMAAYFSHTALETALADPMMPNGERLWWPNDNNPAYRNGNYNLNTTTGNRPARQPVGTMRAVTPSYIFGNANAPKAGDNYRDAFGKALTSDFQFARATVNYIWKEFFGRGIVDPVNQFDPARLDPDNPPPDGWTLQPSNPALLNALAQSFIDDGYDLKKLMRRIATSDAYQLSSRYDGTWNPQWEPLFARKLVRRLWGEEVLDAIAQSSGVPNNFNQAGIRTQWAMQLPEPFRAGSAFLLTFLPGNRDDDPRRPDSSAQQALTMMNDANVMGRVRSTAGTALVTHALTGNDQQLVDTLYLYALSRKPTDAERTAAYALLKGTPRRDKAENLLWSLYNKVDFLFNY